MAAQGMASGEMAGAYPVTLEVDYPEAPRRLAILWRWLFAVPHWLLLSVLENLAQLAALIAAFALVFARHYPVGLYTFVEGYLRWNANAMTYALFDDRYPPFTWERGQYAPARLAIRRPEEFNRWLPLVKWLLAVPHYIALVLLAFLGVFVVLWLVVAVLLTGSYPRGAFDYLVGVGRWSTRVMAYVYLLVDDYPPFSLR